MPVRSTLGNQSTDRALLLERIFDAPRDLVWDAWTDLNHAQRWWGPKELALVYVEMDVRPGGAWKKCMRRAEDGAEFWRSGVYREVVRPERLVFTYVSDDPRGIQGFETLVTVTFEDLGGRTKLTLRQAEFESVEARDSLKGGWTSTLERLGEYVVLQLAARRG